jgi:hypothetical protein
MSAGTCRIGYDEYQQLTPGDQKALHAWITSFFDCNPDHIEWIEFSTDPSVVNWAMQISLLVPEDPKRPTLASEMHVVRVTTLVPNGLLKRLFDVSGVVNATVKCRESAGRTRTNR